MLLEAGHTQLFGIYNFVAQNPEFVAGRGAMRKAYAECIANCTNKIPEEAGWYLWGRFNDIGWWDTVYLGKSGKQKTSSLRARIREELTDEWAAFWATVFGAERTERQFEKSYSKYGRPVRAMRKRNASFIVWISASPIEQEELAKQERVLISAFRPGNNIQRRHEVPSADSLKIIRKIEDEIDAILGRRKPANL
jgi:hypothetical protein